LLRSPLNDRIKRTDAEKLQNEYEKLVSGLQEANEHREDEDMLANPGAPDFASLGPLLTISAV